MIENQGTTHESDDGHDDDAAQEPKTLTLMGGVVSEDPDAFDQSTLPKAEKKLLNSGTLVMVLVAAVAAGSLYLMRLSFSSSLHENRSTRQVAAKVETWLGKLSHPKKLAKNDPMRPENLKRLFANTNSIIKMFATDFTGEQVPIKYVKKNPFQLMVNQSNQHESDAAKQLAMRQLRSSLAQMQLQSVMGGPEPVAVINGKLKRAGDRIGQFKIVSIGNLSVRLEAEGKIFELRMNDGPQNGG